MIVGVAGASGQLGKAIVDEISRSPGLERVVAISRTPERAPLGCESKRGDFDEPDSLRSAFAGLDRVILVPSNDLRPGARARHFVTAIDAAIASRVKHIVLISTCGTRAVEDLSLYSLYWNGERHLIAQAPSWTILRMNYFTESFVEALPFWFSGGVMPGLGEGRVAHVSRADVARTAAALGVAEAGVAGAIFTATGLQARPQEAWAGEIERIAGRPLRYETWTADSFRAALVDRGLPQLYADALVEIERSFIAGCFDIVTGDVALLTGRPPEPFEVTVKRCLDGENLPSNTLLSADIGGGDGRHQANDIDFVRVDK